ncbi:nucleoside recognition protein [Candidatus Comchoanobacter bicostacola]|uniref:Nucleoside recognition protein n=1 Tax=Candidatus Comchoanobacter bicostacola TaxID=2919598 RepID=A0ABY5DJC4_9GAMM|nr:nucleoside recognition domain-containing protein [Candidatus Comchoanobacter bicostacola]UTC24645.1 nucleoside recognition protein [Candidatus Comchoanobacter bicostacola]
MLSIIWFTMIATSITFGAYNGTLDLVLNEIATSASRAFEIALSLGGIMSFWLGITQIAQDSGLVNKLAEYSAPVLSKLFPDIPKNHAALGTISMNICANMLGIGNAATPIGIKAMEQLETLNPYPGVATNAMCTLLAINTSSVQLIPSTALGLLAAAGSANPSIIISTSLIATSASTIVAVTLALTLAKLYPITKAPL